MKRIVYHIALVLIVAQLMLILVSWLLSATLSEHVRSLLSDEGLRWFAGGFSRLLLTPLLSWLLLCAMAYGCLRKSGITRMFFWPKNYREQLAFRLTLFLIVLMVGGMILLSMVPHAILLSATGRLFPHWYLCWLFCVSSHRQPMDLLFGVSHMFMMCSVR